MTHYELAIKSFAEIVLRTFNEGKFENGNKKEKAWGRECNMSTLKGIKKFLKARYQSVFPYMRKRKLKHLINVITRLSECGEHRTTIWIFENTEKTMGIIERNLDLEADKNYYDYSPTGLWFNSEAEIITTKERIIVKQTASLDC